MGYDKGSAFERQVKKKLEEQGFYVVRTAGSGVDGLSPDLVALSTTKKFALECKAIESDYLAIEVPKMERMMDFEKSTGLAVYVAWKQSRRDWMLVPLTVFERKEKNYTLKAENARLGLSLDDVAKVRPAP